jgi:hypothetical protein
MLIKELPGWPGVAGGVGGGEFPTRGEAVLGGVLPARDNQVTFCCTFGGRELRYHLGVDCAARAENLTGVLSRNIGKAVAELGELRVD